MSRPTLSMQLSDRRERLIFDLNEHLSSVKYVCATSDAWSTCGRGYLGVTAHWMVEDTVIRHSAALACRRFKGAHTIDVIAECLSDINIEYNLMSSSTKIIGCGQWV